MNFCKDSVILVPKAVSGTIRWSDGSNKTNLTVRKTGIVWVDCIESCKAYRDSFLVDSNAVKSQSIKLPCMDSVRLTVLGGADSVRWWNGSGKSYVFPGGPGIYWVDKYSACGTSRDTFIVASGNQFIYKQKTFCDNDTLKPSLKNKSGYKWNTGDTSPRLKANKHLALYWVDIQSACEMERDSFTRIQIDFGGSKDTSFCGAFNLKFDGMFDKTKWNDRSQGRYFTASYPGRYIAYYSDSVCGGTSDTINISFDGDPALLFIPNAFTPNNDQLNDSFPSGFRGVSNFRLTVYNFWGEKLFYETNTAWSGMYRGEVVEPGTYVYMIEYWDCYNTWRFLKGKVTVIY